MNRINRYRILSNKKRSAGLAIGALCVLISLSSPGHTFWTGPDTTWTKSASTPSDTIIPGKVVLTRGINEVLYNTAAGETGANPNNTSPADAGFAFGMLSNATSLSYQSLGSLRNGDLAARILNQPMVVWLTNEDIYFSIKFTVWGQFFSGTVSYTRSTAPAAQPPTVNISSPTNGMVFAAPASVNLKASATVSGGTVTNVSYFAGTTLLGRAGATPFAVTGSIPNSGSYLLTAVATAAGVSATSSVVNITVVSPVPVSLTSPHLANGLFSFSYGANPGLTYVVESSSNLLTWVPLATNVPASSPASFSSAVGGNANGYFRVNRQPNP